MTVRRSKSYKAAEKKADKYFSLLIRLEAANQNGYCKCVSCGKLLPIKEIQAGHYHTRNNHLTRWDKRNVNPQCCTCNYREEGSKYGYSKYMFEHYTVEELEELNRLAHTSVKFSIDALDAMSQQFLDEIRQLEKKKGIKVL